MTKSVAVVGRKNTCDLRIPLGAVSRQHFQVEQDGGTLKLKDLGSSNGTYHNGERVLEAELEAGDKVQVGPVTFIVEVDGMPKDIEPVKTVLPDQGDVQSAAEVEAEAMSQSAEPTESVAAGNDASDFTFAEVEDEPHSPTLEIDDEDEEEDPIAALEALASGEGDDEDEQDETEAEGSEDAEDAMNILEDDSEQEKSH